MVRKLSALFILSLLSIAGCRREASVEPEGFAAGDVLKQKQVTVEVPQGDPLSQEELDRAIKDDPSVTRVRRNLRQIRELVAEFFPATNNDSADRKAATGHLTDLAELGFVKRIAESGDGNEAEYELTRLLRAKFNPLAAEDFLERIKSHLARRQSRPSHESA